MRQQETRHSSLSSPSRTLQMVSSDRREVGSDHSTRFAAEQAGPAIADRGSWTSADPRPYQAVQRRKAEQTGMPEGLMTGIERLGGVDVSSVRVHHDSEKPAALGALAYAEGTDIHLGPGQEKHLPHEAWHVVQQARGRVQPTAQLKAGIPVNDDAGLEREADAMGQRALEASATGESDRDAAPVTGETSSAGAVSAQLKRAGQPGTALAPAAAPITISTPIHQLVYEQPPSRDVKRGGVIKKGDPILGGSCYAYSTLNAIIGSLEEPPPADVINTWIVETLARGAGGSPMRVLTAAEGKTDVVSQELSKYQVQTSPAVDAGLGGTLAPLKGTHAVMLSVNVPSNHWISYLGATADQITAVDQQNLSRGHLAFKWCAKRDSGLVLENAVVTGVRYKVKNESSYTELKDFDQDKIGRLLEKPALYKNVEVEAGGVWKPIASSAGLSIQKERAEGWWAPGGTTGYHLDGVFLAKKK